EEVARKREDMRVGRTDRYNVRVRVKLKNGARLSGVVKNGRLVERAEGIDFVEADREAPDAGIRLHYFDDTTSFVFLRWADIESHKVIVKLTDEEVRALERELAERERKRQEALRAAQNGAPTPDGNPAGPGQAPAKANEGAAKDGGDKQTGKTDEAGKEEAAKEYPLLAEFPPAEGWGEARLQEIQRRKIAVGVYPNEREKRFLEVFGEWKAQWDKSQEAGKPQGPPPGKGEAPSAPQK